MLIHPSKPLVSTTVAVAAAAAEKMSPVYEPFDVVKSPFECEYTMELSIERGITLQGAYQEI